MKSGPSRQMLTGNRRVVEKLAAAATEVQSPCRSRMSSVHGWPSVLGRLCPPYDTLDFRECTHSSTKETPAFGKLKGSYGFVLFETLAPYDLLQSFEYKQIS